jgi:hypothetical protein
MMFEAEPEIELPVSCPCCGQQSLSEFRLGVVAEALQTHQMRLYANCHLAGWDASDAELEEIREHLDGLWSAGWQAACMQFEYR